MEENELVQEIEAKRSRSRQRSINVAENKILLPIEESVINSFTTEDKYSKYLESLSKEQIDWEKEFKRRHAQMKKTREELHLLQKKGQELDLSILDEDQRSFLTSKIDFEKHVELCQRLKSNAIKLCIVTERANTLQKALIDLAKKNIDLATQYCIKKL